MEGNKILTAREYISKNYTGDVETAMIEFAHMHVKIALEKAKQVNPQCMWDNSEYCYIAVQNEYGIEKCYPLENIK